MASLATQYEGESGKPNLVAGLQKQWIIDNHPDAAAALADVVVLRELAVGEVLIREGEVDSTLHFILRGKVHVLRDGKTMTTRGSGLHVGEVALIDPTHPRSATVTAVEPTVVATIREDDFTRVAEWFPFMWRRIAIELARRSLDALRNAMGPSV